jgi:NAD(P)-dependent dehydrogenase (short-subunit alcohol dehydrogenase family)
VGTLMNSHASAAKAGVDAITKTLALEWGPKGVRVNGVAPGFIEGTEGYDRLSDLNKSNSKEAVKTSVAPSASVAYAETMVAFTPLQRLGNRNDVSNTVLFLASELSSFMTAQTLLIDGGVFGILPNWMPFFPDYMKQWSGKKVGFPKF